MKFTNPNDPKNDSFEIPDALITEFNLAAGSHNSRVAKEDRQIKIVNGALIADIVIQSLKNTIITEINESARADMQAAVNFANEKLSKL